jgi:hypothetical protein
MRSKTLKLKDYEKSISISKVGVFLVAKENIVQYFPGLSYSSCNTSSYTQRPRTVVIRDLLELERHDSRMLRR